MQILVRDGRKQHQSRRGLAVVFFAQRMLDELFQILFEFGEPRFAAERLVVTEEGQNHVGLVAFEMIVGAAEIGRPQPQRQFVA